MSDTSCYVERFKACVEASPSAAYVNTMSVIALISDIREDACRELRAENEVLREWIRSEKAEAARLRGDSK